MKFGKTREDIFAEFCRQDPVMLFSMGKTGTTALYRALDRYIDRKIISLETLPITYGDNRIGSLGGYKKSELCDLCSIAWVTCRNPLNSGLRVMQHCNKPEKLPGVLPVLPRRPPCRCGRELLPDWQAWQSTGPRAPTNEYFHSCAFGRMPINRLIRFAAMAVIEHFFKITGKYRVPWIVGCGVSARPIQGPRILRN